MLQGQFAVVPFEQVLRLLNSSRVTGTLQVRAAEGRGTIGFRDGAIADASFSRERGLEAFEGICAADLRDFSLRPTTLADGAIETDTAQLIERAGELRAAAAEVRRVIPSYRSQILVSDHVAAGAPVTVSSKDLRVLRAVDGQRDVAEIARRCHLTRRVALASLYALARDGVVRVGAERERERRPALEREAAPVAPEPPTAAPAAAADGPPPSQTDPRIQLIRAAMAASLKPVAATEVTPDTEKIEEKEEIEDRVSLVFRLDEVAGAAAEGQTGKFVSHYLPVDATVAGIAGPRVQPKAPGPKTRIISLFKGGPGEVAGEAAPDRSSPRALAALVNAFADETTGPAPAGGLDEAARRCFVDLPLIRGRFVVEEIAAQAAEPAAPGLILILRQLYTGASEVHEERAAQNALRAAMRRAWGDDVAYEDVLRLVQTGKRIPRARLVVKRGGSDGPFDLADRAYVVGRSSECDIVLRDPSVSRRHIEIVPHKGGFAVRDLGSSAGTSVNGAALSGERGLRSGDQLTIGDVVLAFELSTGAGSLR